MAEPAPDAMQDVVSSVPTEAAAPEEPEHISETLYIQNLNEKIKIDGDFSLQQFVQLTDYLCD
jgi:U2 small nuclear ribonucleoprotein B''